MPDSVVVSGVTTAIDYDFGPPSTNARAFLGLSGQVVRYWPTRVDTVPMPSPLSVYQFAGGLEWPYETERATSAEGVPTRYEGPPPCHHDISGFRGWDGGRSLVFEVAR